MSRSNDIGKTNKELNLIIEGYYKDMQNAFNLLWECYETDDGTKIIYNELIYRNLKNWFNINVYPYQQTLYNSIKKIITKKDNLLEFALNENNILIKHIKDKNKLIYDLNEQIKEKENAIQVINKHMNIIIINYIVLLIIIFSIY